MKKLMLALLACCLIAAFALSEIYPADTAVSKPETPQEIPKSIVSYIEPDENRNSKWITDMEYLRNTILETHPLFGHGEVADPLPFTKEELINQREIFISSFDDLISRIPSLSDADILFDAQLIIAQQLQDVHTKLFLFGNEQAPYYPFRFKGFGLDQYVYLAGEGYEEALGKRLVAINGIDILDILSRIAPYFSTDNGNLYIFLSRVLGQLSYVELLARVGVVNGIEPADYTFVNEDGTTFVIKAEPVIINYDDNPFSNWTKFLPDEKLTRYLDKKPEVRYYYEYWEEESTLYWRDRSCWPMDDYSRVDLFNDMRKVLYENKPRKLIFDFRDNIGGPMNHFDGFLLSVKNAIFSIDTKVYVLVNNSTASAGVVMSSFAKRRLNNITIVGAPCGQAPMTFAGPLDCSLPNSKVKFMCAKAYYSAMPDIDYPTNTLMPDIYIEDSFTDYKNQYDRVIETIKAY